MKKSELIKIIKEELESTLSELGMPSVMALRTGNATAAGLKQKHSDAVRDKRDAHNDKLITALQKMPLDATYIEIEAQDVKLPPGKTLRDLRDELYDMAERSGEPRLRPNKSPRLNKVIAFESPVPPRRLAKALHQAFINLDYND